MKTLLLLLCMGAGTACAQQRVLDPVDPLQLNERALLYAREGDLAMARLLLERANALAPQDVRIAHNLKVVVATIYARPLPAAPVPPAAPVSPKAAIPAASASSTASASAGLAGSAGAAGSATAPAGPAGSAASGTAPAVAPAPAPLPAPPPLWAAPPVR